MMKIDNTNDETLRVQTINECLRMLADRCPAHSNGKPDVPYTINNINVRFAPELWFGLKINYAMKNIPPASQTPFADLMLHPEKLETVLKALKKTKKTAASAARTDARRNPGGRATENAVTHNTKQ